MPRAVPVRVQQKKTKYAPGTTDRTFFASTTEINYRN